MNTCPNCGIDNADSRSFCAVCGTTLREEEPTPPTPTPPPTVELPEWLAMPPTPTGDSSTPPPPKKALPAWLQAAALPPATPPTTEATETAAPTAPASSTPPSALDRLNSVLNDAPLATPRATPTATTNEGAKVGGWDETLDFSDLPDWEEEIPPDLAPLTPFVDDAPPLGIVETQGLLAGVSGVIPIEPIIRQSRTVPPPPLFTDVPTSSSNDEAARLFAQIAGGAVQPEPITVRRTDRRSTGMLHFLLVLTIVISLLYGGAIFSAPAPSPTVQSFAGVIIEQVSADATILVAVDYDGAVMDEINPSLVATLTHLRRVAPNGRIIAVSSSPVGATLAEQAWAQSEGEGATWENRGFIPGGTTGQRATLTTIPATLTIVVAGDSNALQRWLEQVTAIDPERPMLAIVPARAETMVRPYLNSGQIDGAIANPNDSAAYEVNLGEPGAAWRRVDTATVAALVVVVAMLVGTIRGWNRRR